MVVKPGFLAEHSHAEPNVLDYCFAKTCAARFAAFLPDSLHIAEAFSRLPRRGLRRHAGGNVLRRALLDVKAQFLVNRALDRGPLEKCLERIHGHIIRVAVRSWINSRRSAGGKPAGQQSYAEKKQRIGCESQRICGADSKQERLRDAGQGQSRSQADEQSKNNGFHSLFDDQPENPSSPWHRVRGGCQVPACAG